MRHPTEGVLRRLLDEPDGVADTHREHVTGCEECLAELAVIGDDARVVGAALATEEATDVDVDAGWARLSSAAAAPTSSRTPTAPTGRFRSLLRRPVAAGVAVAVVVAGAGAAAANDWLPIFRTERVDPVSFTPDDLNALPDLAAYGEVVRTGEPDLRPVTDAAAAEAATGLDVPGVTTLPQGVAGAPAYRVADEVSATFTFSADRAARAAADAGEALPPPPPGMDGSAVRLVAGPAVAAVWSGSTGLPTLIVGRAVAPTAFSSSGVPFETLRDYLLSLPGVPDDVEAALRAFNADGATLPLPVPADDVTTRSASVDGRHATVLATRDRTLSAAVWVDDGVLTVVAGTVDTDEVLAVARGLR